MKTKSPFLLCGFDLRFSILISGGPGSTDRAGSRHETGGVCALRGRQPLLGGKHHHHMWTAASFTLRGIPGWPPCWLLVWHHDGRPPPFGLEPAAQQDNEAPRGWGSAGVGMVFFFFFLIMRGIVRADWSHKSRQPYKRHLLFEIDVSYVMEKISCASVEKMHSFLFSLRAKM